MSKQKTINKTLEELMIEIHKLKEDIYKTLVNNELNKLNAILKYVHSLCPNDLDLTIRLQRWDGKLIDQIGIVYSNVIIKDTIRLPLGELHVTLMAAPKQDVSAINKSLIWLGLNFAGKTTLLHRYKYGEFKSFPRTIGVSIESLILKDTKIINIDVSGQKTIRMHWQKLIPKKPNLIYFVVDSADVSRFDEVVETLEKNVISVEKFKNVPIIFVANKQDLPNALPPEKLPNSLKLYDIIPPTVSWDVVGTSAKTGLGLDQLMELTVKKLKKSHVEK